MEISQNRTEIEGYLRQFNWDSMLSRNTMDSIELCRFEGGEYIFRGGDTKKWFFLHVEGRSKAYRAMENGETMLVRFYKPFQVLGDLELFLTTPVICSVKAIGPVSCLRIPTPLMREEIRHNIVLLQQLAGGLATKLASFNRTAAVNQHYTLEIRLAAYLRMIYLDGEEFRESRDEMETENLGEMADFLGCSYRHLSRTLERFKTEGLLEKKGKKIRILDPKGLRTRSEDVQLVED